MAETSPHWYAVRTRCNHEFVVADILRRKRDEVFLPTFRTESRRRDRRQEIDRPLFPGYLLVRFGFTPEHHLEICKTHGIAGFIGCRPGSADPVPDEEIEAVRRVLALDVGPRPCPYLREGMPVRVMSGILKGLEGLYRFFNEKKGALILSVHLLGQSISVEVDPHAVEPC